MDRRTALEKLGLDDPIDLGRLKQRFRTLARDLHPDRGGDPAAFQDLHTAYEVVRGSLGRPRRDVPAVARGVPSRTAPASEEASQLDADALDTAAAALARTAARPGGCRSVSRGPGAWSNRLAASLSEATASTLVLLPLGRRSGAGPHVVHIELTARGRGARRAVGAVEVTALRGAAWSRRRGDAVTLLEADVEGTDVAGAARRAAAATVLLLDALGWPLREWRPDGPAVTPPAQGR